MLSKIFLATLILTLFVASALAVTIVNEQNSINKEDKNTFNVIIQEDSANNNLFRENNEEYLNYLVRKLRRDIENIPAVAVSLY